jgi:replicative DNA helicase
MIDQLQDDVISSKDFKTWVDSKPKIPRTLYGLPLIDKYTKGFAPGELIIITGYSGHGKTTFLQSVSARLSNQGHKILWISYELTPSQFIEKFHDPLPDFYLPKEVVAYNIEWIEKKICESITKYQVQSIFIDHLHYVLDMSKTNENNSTLIGYYCRQLKQMAIKYNVTVFLIAHTKQPKGDSLPSLGDIRDSSFIAQESDAVYSISRLKNDNQDQETYSTESVFSVLKQRETGAMGKNIILTFKNKMMYEQITKEDDLSLNT